MTADTTLRALDVPRLVVVQPDGKEVHHHVAGGEITIGRDPSNRICLSDHFVSKFHAKILVSGQTMTLVDLDSANKTYVNGVPIAEKTIRFGDAIRFASVQCRLEGPESASKPAPVAAVAAPPTPAPAAPKPPARSEKPTPKPRPSAAPKSPARPGPPPVEADPMKRLLVIGGALILVSLVLGVVLRVLLVPSETPGAAAEASPKGASTAEPSATLPTTSVSPATSETPSGPASESARPGAAVDASGNRSAEFYFEEGLSYLDTGRLKEAQTSFRKVLELDPDHSRARTRLSLLDEEIESKAGRHFDAAREAFQFLRYDEAIAEWEMFLLLADPGDVRYAEAQGGIEQAKAKLR